VDLDNSFKYSPVASVQIGRVSNQLYSIYPNPVKGHTFVRSTSAVPTPVTITLMDNSGREVMRKTYTVSKAAPARVDLANIVAGTYIVKILSGDNVSTDKLVIF
jgi:hypothetical protein